MAISLPSELFNVSAATNALVRSINNSWNLFGSLLQAAAAAAAAAIAFCWLMASKLNGLLLHTRTHTNLDVCLHLLRMLTQNENVIKIGSRTTVSSYLYNKIRCVCRQHTLNCFPKAKK
uniref:Uncharacterized protein n=1 Tax=Glossina austeni TaxID=7395 RepID=A0A1A9UPH4_GLOAU